MGVSRLLSISSASLIYEAIKMEISVDVDKRYIDLVLEKCYWLGYESAEAFVKEAVVRRIEDLLALA
jgi:hypothetical protein